MSDEAEAACASSDEGKPAPAAGGAYNGMIKPLLNMTIYGAVWSENAIFAPFYTKNQHFTKTGSGQA
jgi:hypothetical protein